MALQDVVKNLDIDKLGLKVLSDKELGEIQNTLETMLSDFDEVCTRYDIEWCLFGGSVLGAVRHNGFIPWDDDVDVFMTRENYNKFRDIAEQEMSDKYVLKEPGYKNYIYHFPQLQLRHTELEAIQTIYDANDGLYVDIFILENVPNSTFLRMLHGMLCSVLLFIDSAIRMRKCRSHILEYAGTDEVLVKSVNKRAAFAGMFSFLPIEKWLQLSDKCFSLVKKSDSKYVSCPSGRLHYFKETYSRKEMCTYVKHTFESHEWNIPQGFEYYLTKRYGKNYMQIPAKDRQEKHIYVKLNLQGNSKGDII